MYDGHIGPYIIKINELDNVYIYIEGTRKKIDKQQGLRYSNKEQQAHKNCSQLGSMQLVYSELEEVEGTSKKED